MPLSASFPPLSSPVTDVRWSCCDIEGRKKKKSVSVEGSGHVRRFYWELWEWGKRWRRGDIFRRMLEVAALHGVMGRKRARAGLLILEQECPNWTHSADGRDECWSLFLWAARALLYSSSSLFSCIFSSPRVSFRVRLPVLCLREICLLLRLSVVDRS